MQCRWSENVGTGCPGVQFATITIFFTYSEWNFFPQLRHCFAVCFCACSSFTLGS